MQIAEIIKEIRAGQLKKIAALQVRELDELEPGKFEAYVDEGAVSFDVGLRVEKNELVDHQCDCGAAAAPLCIHRLAVLMQVGTGTKKKVLPAAKAKRVKKMNPLEQLINEVEVPVLRAWLYDLLKANKDIAFAFNQHFGKAELSFTTPEIIAITESAAKAVAKNRRKLEQSAVKKIIDLWTAAHAPVLEATIRHLTEPGELDKIYNMLLDIRQHYEVWYQVKTVRFMRYREQVLEVLIQPLYDIEVDSTWQQLIRQIAALAVQDLQLQSTIWFQLLDKVTRLETRPQREAFLLKELLNAAKSVREKIGYMPHDFADLLWNLFNDKGRSNEALAFMDIFSYSTPLNLKIIDAMIEHGMYARAAESCNTLLTIHNDPNFEVPLFGRLRSIYDLQSNMAALKQIVMKLIKIGWDTEDFKLVYQKISSAAGKKEWEEACLKMVEHAFKTWNVDHRTYSFIYDLSAFTGHYEWILKNLSKVFRLAKIIEHFEPMVAWNKPGFLMQLAAYFKNGQLGYNEKDLVPQIWELLLKHYPALELYVLVQDPPNKGGIVMPNAFKEHGRHVLKNA